MVFGRVYMNFTNNSACQVTSQQQTPTTLCCHFHLMCASWSFCNPVQLVWRQNCKRSYAFTIKSVIYYCRTVQITEREKLWKQLHYHMIIIILIMTITTISSSSIIWLSSNAKVFFWDFRRLHRVYHASGVNMNGYGAVVMSQASTITRAVTINEALDIYLFIFHAVCYWNSFSYISHLFKYTKVVTDGYFFHIFKIEIFLLYSSQ